MDELKEPHRASGTGGRCGGCGCEATLLRRGRCASCYARWVRARPVGTGAVCACCGDRRLVHLRHFELHEQWVVLCHNCCARAELVTPLPRSVDQLRARIARERRSTTDRRTADRRTWSGYQNEGEERRGQDVGHPAEHSQPDTAVRTAEVDADDEITIDIDESECGFTGLQEKV